MAHRMRHCVVLIERHHHGRLHLARVLQQRSTLQVTGTPRQLQKQQHGGISISRQQQWRLQALQSSLTCSSIHTAVRQSMA